MMVWRRMMTVQRDHVRIVDESGRCGGVWECEVENVESHDDDVLRHRDGERKLLQWNGDVPTRVVSDEESSMSTSTSSYSTGCEWSIGTFSSYIGESAMLR